MFDPQTPPAPTIWLMSGNIPTGPFDPAQVHAKLAAEEITWQTLACPVGGRTWLPLVQFLRFWPSAVVPRSTTTPSPVSPAQLTLSAPPLRWSTPVQPTVIAATVEQESGVGRRPARPWNPMAIGWLGVLFSPLWAGVMAALNGRRLESPIPFWMPLAVAFGWLAAELCISPLFDTYLINLALYVGALGLLWRLVLRHQQPFFAALPVKGPGVRAHWVWPAIAGAPFALLAFLAFVVMSLLPLEPRQVCEKFNAASSAREAAKYTTANLIPALEALYAQQGQGPDVPIELTDEAAAPSDVGGLPGRLSLGVYQGGAAGPPGGRVPSGQLHRRVEDRGPLRHDRQSPAVGAVGPVLH